MELLGVIRGLDREETERVKAKLELSNECMSPSFNIRVILESTLESQSCKIVLRITLRIIDT